MDSLLKYVEFIPAYLTELITLSTSPKTFLKNRNTGADGDWSRALGFFGLSSAIAFLIISGMHSDANFVLHLSKALVFWTIGILSVALAIKISWRIVGGKASFNSILLTHLYVYSVYILLLGCLNVIFVGLIAIFYPEAYHVILKMVTDNGIAGFYNQMMSNPADMTSLFKNSPGFIWLDQGFAFILDAVMLVWIIAIWGAYRELNGASRARSFAAFILCGFISIPTLGLLLLFTAGGTLPTPQH